MSTSPVHTRRSALLPSISSNYNYTLVLDLDETLVHCDQKEKLFKLRPNCVSFLKNMSRYYEIIIFTAASQDYADYILDILDKEKNLISHRLYRQHTQYDDGVYVKDLNILGRDLTKTIIIDNIKENFERQERNGIEILTWTCDPKDRELDKLSVFLKGLFQSQVKDVRPMLDFFKNDSMQSPSKQLERNIDLPGDINPKGCTPHSGKKHLEAKFVR